MSSSYLKIASAENADRAARYCGELVARARKEGLWMYDPENKQWSSPDHFEHVYGGMVVHRSLEWFEQIELRDPIKAIENGLKRIAELQRAVLMLTSMIMTQATKKR